VKRDRDYVGYGAHPPVFDWPGGKRLAVNFVVNYEEGSEYSYAHGDARQENLGEWGVKAFPDGIPNLANESFFQYGSRVGFWRLLRLFDQYDVPVTFGVCAVALEKNPEAARAIVEAGHEINAHGYRWEEHFAMSRDEERERIRLAVASIEALTGDRPRGWYCRTAPSLHTRELIVEEGGFEYDSDAYDDDVPYFVEVAGRKHVVVPYTGDVNDSHFWLSGGYETDFATYLCDTFDELYEESRSMPRMMSVGLHMRMVGRPGRMRALRRFLDHASSKGDVWFATRLQIARAFREAMEGSDQAS
jgi:peptidoglycan/xylan/chitin deacetylase (PgdA/CDA1 family)